MENTELIQKRLINSSTRDAQKTAAAVALDIAAFLSDEIDELNVFSHVFKTGLERNLIKIFRILHKQEQTVVIFPDSIPGFTAMIFKKAPLFESDEKTQPLKNPIAQRHENQAVEKVIGKFFSKNQQKIMIIETDDLLMALFPVADTRKNLKEMDLYVTY